MCNSETRNNHLELGNPADQISRLFDWEFTMVTKFLCGKAKNTNSFLMRTLRQIQLKGASHLKWRNQEFKITETTSNWMKSTGIGEPRPENEEALSLARGWLSYIRMNPQLKAETYDEYSIIYFIAALI